MRNYLQTFWARTEWDFDFNPPDPPLHRQQYLFAPTNDDLQEQIRLFFEGLAADPQNKNMTIVRQGPVYWLMDKTNLFYALDMSHVALKDEGFTENMILFKTDPDFESPRDGWKDVSGVKREPPPSENVAKYGKGGLKVSGGIWIIARLFLYFAGFEAGTGDPIFVKYVLGAGRAPNAILYLSPTLAEKDAVRIRKIYKRPDIPVDVVEI